MDLLFKYMSEHILFMTPVKAVVLMSSFSLNVTSDLIASSPVFIFLYIGIALNRV